MADTQDRIPPEAIEAAQAALDKYAEEQGYVKLRTWDQAPIAVTAAYPLILRAVCQELAEALTRAPDDQVPGPVQPFDVRLVLDFAAEFVESYGGASPGGEHG